MAVEEDGIGNFLICSCYLRGERETCKVSGGIGKIRYS